MTTTSTNVIKTLGAADLDTQELVTNLVAATKEPRQKLIDVEKKKAEVAISTTALLGSALTALQNTATEIGSIARLNQLVVSSSNSSIVSGGSSGTGAARAGSYSIKVSALAEPQRRASKDLASTFTAAATTLTFSSGGASGFVSSAVASENEVSITAGSTPSQVVATINESTVAKNNKIKATLVDKKTAAGGTGPYVIVIQSQSGTANGFSIASSDATDALGLDRAITTAVNPADNPPADAEFTVNNVSLKRSSNTITDAISGVSLNLNSAAPGSTVILNVASDSSAVTSNVKNFVEAFNLLSDLVKRATGPAVEGDDIAGTLKADNNARGIFLALRAKITKESSSASGSITHFNSIGVSFDRNGVLQFDESKLTAAMQSAPEDVIKALSNNRLSPSTTAQLASGLAGDVAVAAAGMMKSTGVVKAMATGFEDKKLRVDSKQAALDSYIERLQNQYEKQFASLNAVLANYKATSQRLTSTFNQNSND